MAVALVASALAVAACSGNTGTPVSSTAAPTAAQATVAPAASATATLPSGAASAPPGGALVGIAMPTRSSMLWIEEGDHLVTSLTALGYTTDLQYANDDVPTQVSQVQDMITEGAKVLVIAAIDGTSLTDVLQTAADVGVKVVAYDRLIRDSPNVDYYATFDNFRVGVLQAGSIVDALRIGSEAGPFNIELFADSPDDNNAGLSFSGAMSVLQPYIDRGDLVVQSKQVHFPDEVGTLGSDGAAAQARMDSILATYYADRRVDAVLSPDDGISRHIIASLKQADYYTAEKPGPAISGQDADLLSVKSILAGEQTSTVFKDPRIIAAQAARMIDQMITGATVDVNNTKASHNGVKLVPTFHLDVVSVTKANVQDVLVDSGYFVPSDLQ